MRGQRNPTRPGSSGSGWAAQSTTFMNDTGLESIGENLYTESNPPVHRTKARRA